MWSIIILLFFPVLTLTETCLDENERLKNIINDAIDLLSQVKLSDNKCADVLPTVPSAVQSAKSTFKPRQRGGRNINLRPFRSEKKSDNEGSKKDNNRDLDCSDLYNRGIKTSGVYTIWPKSTTSETKSLNVYCDMSEGGGWTVIMKIHLTNLDKDWKSFKEGFGDNTLDFYLGNDNIFMLTNQRLYNVSYSSVFFKSRQRLVQECEFRIDSELKNYTLHAPDCKVAFGQNLFQNNGMQFSAKDRDNDKDPDTNCAEQLKYGWWYSVCFPEGEPFKVGGELPIVIAKIRPQNFSENGTEFEDN